MDLAKLFSSPNAALQALCSREKEGARWAGLAFVYLYQLGMLGQLLERLQDSLPCYDPLREGFGFSYVGETVEFLNELCVDGPFSPCPWKMGALLNRVCGMEGDEQTALADVVQALVEAARERGDWQLLSLPLLGSEDYVVIDLPEGRKLAPVGSQPDRAVQEAMRLDPQMFCRHGQPEVYVWYGHDGKPHLTTFAMTMLDRYPEGWRAIQDHWKRVPLATRRALRECNVQIEAYHKQADPPMFPDD